MASLGSSLADRYYSIKSVGDVVCEAASAAVKAENPALAAEWLEQGRSVIWGQLLRLRTPLDELRERYPEHAQRLQDNSFQLENATSRRDLPAMSVPGEGGIQSTTGDLADVARQGHQLALEREKLLIEIRHLKGFERFLLPKLISELTPAASAGPIVILNLSEIHRTCFGIILRPELPSDVLAIELPSFSPSKARRLHKALQEILLNRGRIIPQEATHGNSNFTSQRNRSEEITDKVLNELIARAAIDAEADGEIERDGGPCQRPGTDWGTLVSILVELWECVAKPVLNAIAIRDPTLEVKQRLWWCPTGIISFLPIHAAGIYTKNEPSGSKLSDFVISSYTPTVTALLESAPSSSEPQAQVQLLAVAQPESHGLNRIPGTEKEIDTIKSVLGNVSSVKTLVREEATLATVIEGLKTSDWAHFACHGVQNPINPLESALLVGKSEKLTLSHLASIKRTGHGGLAFLSACQTAKGDEALRDESVHLGAGMLTAGYRGVIATMWSVGDGDAPRVAEEVYRHLKESGLDTSEAASALDRAVQKLRDDHGASAISWVPFIHIGR